MKGILFPNRTCDIVPCHRSYRIFLKKFILIERCWIRVGAWSRIIEYINQTRLVMGGYVTLEKQIHFYAKSKTQTRNEVWRKPKREREREMTVMEKLKIFIVQEPVVAASCLIAGVGNFLSYTPNLYLIFAFLLNLWLVYAFCS